MLFDIIFESKVYSALNQTLNKMSCVVEGCKNHSSRKNIEDESFTFHRFPTDGEMKMKWIQCMNRYNWTPNKHSRICSKHFTKDSFVQINENKKWRRLKSNAVPIVNMPEKTYNFVVDPLAEIKIENTSINLENNISSFDSSTSADKDEVESASEKKIRLLEKKVENLKSISKRRLQRINTLTKRITRLTKKNVDLFTVLCARQFKNRKCRNEIHSHVA